MMRLRAYIDLRAHQSFSDSATVADRICEYLGPAIIDRSGWGLLRPGILTRKLIEDARKSWGQRGSLDIPDRPQVSGNWIFFDYLFAKATTVNPIIRSLAKLGLMKYEEIKLANTYAITMGLNYKEGVLLALYGGRKIEKELDDLAYVISHLLKSDKPRVVKMTQKVLVEFAKYFSDSLRWSLQGWESKDGSEIEADLVGKRREEYLAKLREGEWRSLRFKDKHTEAKVRLYSTSRLKSVDVTVKKRHYVPGPRRNLGPVFEEISKGLEEISKGLKAEHTMDISPSGADEAGILRSYTERRGIVATIKFERENRGREAQDQSYEFRGYDVRSDPDIIEVKAFRDAAIEKAIELTKNEYETMSNKDNYRIYVIEESWDDIPKVNVISDPKTMRFNRHVKDVLKVEMSLSSEEYFVCDEAEWRGKISSSHNVNLVE